MTTTYYGRHNTGSDPAMGTIPAGYQRAYIADKLNQQVIFYQLGGRVGGIIGGLDPTARFFIGDGNSGSPGALLGYTGSFVVTSDMSFGGDGGSGTTKDLLTPVVGNVNDYLALGVTASGAALNHGMIASADIAEEYEDFWQKSIGSSIPDDPLGGSLVTPGHQGWMTIWALGEISVAPNQPTAVGPSGTLSDPDLTPLITASFSDDNETLPNGVSWDYLDASQIRVRRVSDNVSMWDSGWLPSTATERSARQTQREYAGAALSSGVAYIVSVRHRDRTGNISIYSEWSTFTINAAGQVLVSGVSEAPEGKVNSQQPTPFVAQWSHPSALAMAEVRGRIETEAGGLVKEGTWYDIANVANGGAISVSWNNLIGAATVLPRGGRYRWKMKGKDTGAVESPYSDPVYFNVNATPSIPTLVSPINSAAVTQHPTLKVLATDADDLASALTITIEIKRADTTTVTVTAAYNAATGYHERLVTNTEVPTTQTVQWRAKASDGTSESAYSGYATYIYASGPAVTPTDPTDEQTLTTAAYRFAWTVPSGGPQVKYDFTLWRLDDDDQRISPAAISTGDVVSSNLYHDVVAGQLHEGRYEWTVKVTNATPLSGTSQARQFTVDFPPAESVQNPRATPIRIASDSGSDAIRLDWDPLVLTPPDLFVGLDIRRTDLGPVDPTLPPLVDDPTGTVVFLRRIDKVVQGSFIDSNVISGRLYEYSFTTVADVALGGDTVESDPISVVQSIELPYVVLTSARNPETYGVELRHVSPSSDYLTADLRFDRRQVVPVGASLGRTIETPYRSWQDKLDFLLIETATQSISTRFDRLVATITNGGTLCFRTFDGLRRFVACTGLQVKYRTRGYMRVSLDLKQELFIEGETL